MRVNYEKFRENYILDRYAKGIYIGVWRETKILLMYLESQVRNITYSHGELARSLINGQTNFFSMTKKIRKSNNSTLKILNGEGRVNNTKPKDHMSSLQDRRGNNTKPIFQLPVWMEIQHKIRNWISWDDTILLYHFQEIQTRFNRESTVWSLDPTLEVYRSFHFILMERKMQLKPIDTTNDVIEGITCWSPSRSVNIKGKNTKDAIDTNSQM